jgi:hypothetical protein
MMEERLRCTAARGGAALVPEQEDEDWLWHAEREEGFGPHIDIDRYRYQYIDRWIDV